VFEFTETVKIKASSLDVWARIADPQSWWLASNPEHISIEVRSANKAISSGTEIAFQERVAGVKAQAVGVMTKVTPGIEATWEGTASYHYCGFRVRIREGVSWRIESCGARESKLSARVWAHFPPGILGLVFEWYSKTILNVVERDREHARRELHYLQRSIETSL
jgi:hypothetical protein